MKICVINAHLPAFAPMARLTTYSNRANYCARHGYDLKVFTGPWIMPAAHPVSWDRFQFMRGVLGDGRYDWIYCCGVDTLHTNFHIRLESLVDDAFHVIISPDWCAPVQADSFLVRSSPEGLAYMDDILSHYPQDKGHVWVENKTMIDTLPKHRAIIKILPQRALNAYNYKLFEAMYPDSEKVRRRLDFFGNDGQWQPGDFLIHWPSLPLAVRIAEIEKTLPLVLQ